MGSTGFNYHPQPTQERRHSQRSRSHHQTPEPNHHPPVSTGISRLRRGYIHPDTGRIFWGYRRDRISVAAGEIWATKEGFDRRVISRRVSRSRYNAAHRHEAVFKVRNMLVSRISHIVTRRAGRISSCINLLGCTPLQLVKHLEQQFISGMSWGNYGRSEGCWSIDHIKPCASFDLMDQEQQKKCFHYTNLQPLWHIENMRKHCST